MGFWDPGECLKIMTAAAGWLHRSMAAIQRMSRLCCFIKFESLHKIFKSCSVQTQSWFFSQELFLLMVTFIFWRHLRFFFNLYLYHFSILIPLLLSTMSYCEFKKKNIPFHRLKVFTDVHRTVNNVNFQIWNGEGKRSKYVLQSKQ